MRGVVWPAAGVGAALGYPLLGAGAWADAYYLAVAVAVLAGMATAVASRRPCPQGAWWALVVALGCFVLGDALWMYYEHVLDQDPFPSAADAAYLGGYVPLLAGVLLLLRARRTDREASAGLEAGVVALALALGAWEWVLEPTVVGGEGSVLARAIGAAYPLADLLVVAVLARMLLEGEWRNGALRLLALGLLCAVVADVAFLVQEVYEVDAAVGQLSNCAFLLEYALLAAAAWHRAAATPPTPAETTFLGRHRLLLVGACAAVGPFLLLTIDDPEGIDLRVIAVASLVLTGLVLWRTSRLVAAVRASAQLIAHRAAHDALTGLLNRERFGAVVAEALTEGREAAVVRVDLDGFRAVNDLAGHEAGNRLLLDAADRARACAPSAVWARLGGDEFGALLTGPGATDAAAVLGDELVRCLRAPFDVRGERTPLRASAGMAGTGSSAGTADALLAAADVALSVAKARGGGQAVEHRPEHDSAVLSWPALAARLEHALEAGELEVHYQPVVASATGRMLGSEALVRWRRDGSLVSPADFLPVAHTTGLIVEIDRFVLQRAVGQLAAWDAARLGSEQHYLGVNFSIRSLERPELVDEVLRVLSAAGIAPQRLLVEVTEEAAASSAAVRDALARLRAYGLRVGLDDFGTGYSSLAYLEQIPADVLKVAKPLVDPLVTEDAPVHVLRMLVGLARACGLEVLAEGVETARQRDRLVELGVPRCQGYLFDRPLPAAELEARLREAAALAAR
nr:bifunctional diguanylate cyclase/phosphodiesterase [Motilibacter aurantiacus]